MKQSLRDQIAALSTDRSSYILQEWGEACPMTTFESVSLQFQTSQAPEQFVIHSNHHQNYDCLSNIFVRMWFVSPKLYENECALISRCFFPYITKSEFLSIEFCPGGFVKNFLLHFKIMTKCLKLVPWPLVFFFWNKIAREARPSIFTEPPEFGSWPLQSNYFTHGLPCQVSEYFASL